MLHVTSIAPGVDEVTLVLLPQMTTTERDNLTLVNGLIIYNTTTTTVQVYQGGAWANV
jgi:hypothetical protein